MSNRKAADILTMLAEEVSQLAQIAHTIDLDIGDLDLRQLERQHQSDLQRVDALHQHLEDVAAILRSMGGMVGPEPDVDVTALGEKVRLDYIRTRLLDTSLAPEATPPNGTVELF